MTDSVVVEGYARLRDGKKWKTRWLVLRKPSPVADCLVLLVFKDKSNKAQGNKERAGVTLEEICGLEAGQWHEGVAFTLSILCLNQAALLGFDSQEALQAWDARLRHNLGEVHRFSVGVLPGTKLDSGPATLHLCNNLLALARDVPPVVVSHWSLPDLRRYGPVPNGFVFEGGTRCGYWAGVFLLASAESEQISFLFDCIVRGISPSRGPFGLRPVLPDPGSGRADSEERLNREARELEKRLSLLSHRSSTASSCPSVGGDDRSISGSSDASDTSQSDGSVGSRLAIWTEPASGPPDGAGHAGAKALAPPSAEKPPVHQAGGGGGGGWPAAKPPRRLQEIGRQSSSDSGIATGSHSSYTGSFSSYTGSLDINPGEDFGSLFSLPPHLAQDLSPCTCPPVPGHAYQAPTSLRYLYDTPRSLSQEGGRGAKDDGAPAPAEGAPASTGPAAALVEEDGRGDVAAEAHSASADGQPVSERLQAEAKTDKAAAAAASGERTDPCHASGPGCKTIVTICSVCGGVRGTPCIPSSGSVVPAIPAVEGFHFPPEHRIFNPADQNVDRPVTSPGSGSARCSGRPAAGAGEDSPPPEKAGENLAGLSAGLSAGMSASPRARVPPGNGTTLYVSMSPRCGSELKVAPPGAIAPSPDSQQRQRASVYESCLRCRGERCRPPPRVAPAGMCRGGGVSAPGAAPAREIPQPEAAAEGEPPREEGGDGSQRVDGRRRCEEMSGQTVMHEDKRLNCKEERRRADPAYEIMDGRAPERNPEADGRSKYEPMGSCGQQRLLQEAEVFVFPPEAPLHDRPRGDGATYVNIPISPTAKKQLNYMELELQEPGAGGRGTVAHLPPPSKGKSSSKYAQIDIAATETAHKVGTQHALGRQEGLHTLEQRRKGTPH